MRFSAGATAASGLSVVDRNKGAEAAEAIIDPDTWSGLFKDGFARIAGRFGRVEPRRNARDYPLAVSSDVDTRSCWQLAEQASHATPYRMQNLLGRAV